MTTNSYDSWTNPDFPYIVTDLTEINNTISSWILEKKESITILGPAGSGKSLIVENIVNHNERIIKIRGEANPNFSPTLIEDDTKINVIIWDNLEEIGMDSNWSSEQNFYLDLKKKIQDLRLKKNVIQIFMLQTIDWKEPKTINTSLLKWLNNSTVQIYIDYDKENLRSQLIERGASISGEKLIFTGNFKVFKEAFNNSKLSDDEKKDILKTIVGPEFGPIFFQLKNSLYSNPIHVKVVVCEEIPDLLGYDEKYWQAVSKLFNQIIEHNYNFDRIDISSQVSLKKSFIVEGITPVEWLTNHFNINKIWEFYSEIKNENRYQLETETITTEKIIELLKN